MYPISVSYKKRSKKIEIRQLQQFLYCSTPNLSGRGGSCFPGREKDKRSPDNPVRLLKYTLIFYQAAQVAGCIRKPHKVNVCTISLSASETGFKHPLWTKLKTILLLAPAKQFSGRPPCHRDADFLTTVLGMLKFRWRMDKLIKDKQH